MNTTHHDNRAKPNNNGQLIVEETRFSITDLIENLIYYRWHFLVVLLLVTSTSVFYAFFARPIFTSDVLIQVDRKTGGAFSPFNANTQSSGLNLFANPQSSLFTEIEIVKSRSIIGGVVVELQKNISVSVTNYMPIVGNILSRVLSRESDGLVSPPFGLNRWAWGGEKLVIGELTVPSRLYDEPLILLVEEDQKWQLFSADGHVVAKGVNGGLTVALDSELRLRIDTLLARPGTKFEVTVSSEQDSINRILRSLLVLEDRRQTALIKLQYKSPDPLDSAKVLNAIARRYVALNVERLSEEAERTLRFMNQELPKVKEKLERSEQALNDFRSNTKTIDVQTETKELLSKITLIDKMRFELELKRIEYMQRYDSNHPLMQTVKLQTDGLVAETESVNNKISRLPTTEQVFLRLARQVDIDNRLYVSLLSNTQQLQITKAGITGTSLIIDEAVVPRIASEPKKALIVAIGTFAGVILGFGICQLLGFTSKVVLDPKKLEQETNLATLAILPLDYEQEKHHQQNDNTSYLLAKAKPSSSAIEAIRSLRTAVVFKLSEKKRSKVVLITSAVPAQGKSFIAANLSYLMSTSGKKTLLIEADIRLASIKRYISYDSSSIGLSSVLRNEAPIETAILKEIYPQLDYLPSGPVVRNPGDLLASDKILELINSLAILYDYVIIDSPPLLPVHDARSLGQVADITLFVVRQHDVSSTEVLDAIDVFNKVGNTIDGFVFNGFVPSRVRYGYGYSYGYRYGYGLRRFYGKLYGRYGAKYGSYGSYGSKYGSYNTDAVQTLDSDTSNKPKKRSSSS